MLRTHLATTCTGYWMPLVDSLKALVSENEHEVWILPRDGIKANTCFRRVVIAFHAPTDLLTPHVGEPTECYSPNFSGCCALLRSRLGLRPPTKREKEKMRVLFIGRDNTKSETTNWNDHQYARMISNQPELISFLAGKCAAFGCDFRSVLPVNLEDLPTVQEQAMQASWADVLIGVHGAGLTAMMFMYTGSGVVEMHIGSRGNFHYENMAVKLGNVYHNVDGNKDGENLTEKSMDALWETTKEAIADVMERTFSGSHRNASASAVPS